MTYEVPALPREETSSPSRHLNGGALSRFTGTSPVEVGENIGFGVVTRVTKGRWRVGLNEPIPTGFSTSVSYVHTNPLKVWVSAVTPTYAEIRARDFADVAQDCSQVIVSMNRVIS